MKVLQEQLISLDPDPPTAGQSLEICYDFSEVSIDETTLTVTFEPEGDPEPHTVKREDDCFAITVPENATQITVQDSSGLSPDLVRAVA